MRGLSIVGCLLLVCASAGCEAVPAASFDAAPTDDGPTTNVDASPGCGNGVCDPTETCVSCATDCGACCGNGGCQPALAEDCMSCQVDCGTCPPGCGDGTCNGGENCAICPSDCGTCPPFCGDGACNGSEDCSTCAVDCGSCPVVCGDGACQPGETCGTCPGDCGTCPAGCGDGVCDPTIETCSFCPDDCGPCPPVCGDGLCEGGETCSLCPGDCGLCPGFCGDGACNGIEACDTCPGDCGMCGGCGDLRVWYQFEEAGGTVLDASGCGNNGFTSGGVAPGVPGWFGNAYSFNEMGTPDGHVVIPYTPSLGGLSQLTIEAWITHTGGGFEAILSHGSPVGAASYRLYLFAMQEIAFDFGNYSMCTGTSTAISSGTGVFDAAWHHVAVSSNANIGGTIRLYLDGNLVNESVGYPYGAFCDSPDDIFVGGIDPFGGYAWQGEIDELKFWAVERTPDEVCLDAGGTFASGTCAL